MKSLCWYDLFYLCYVQEIMAQVESLFMVSWFLVLLVLVPSRISSDHNKNKGYIDRIEVFWLKWKEVIGRDDGFEIEEYRKISSL